MAEVPGSLDLGGTRVHYVSWPGPGDPVVLVHGLGSSHATWCAVAPELARSHAVYALDLSGFGASPGRTLPWERNPEGGGAATVAANTRLLVRFVTRVVRRPATLVGHSMGGTIALLAAAASPSTTSAVALISPALPGDLRAAGPIDVRALGALAASAIRTWAFGDKEMASAGLLLATAAHALPADALAANVAAAADRRQQPWAATAQAEALVSLGAALAGGRRIARAAAAVRCPVLVVHGEADPVLPVGLTRAFAARHPRWRLVVIPGAGHVPQLETPDQVLAALDELLELELSA